MHDVEKRIQHNATDSAVQYGLYETVHNDWSGDINDYDILSIARNAAIKIIQKYPELNKPELKKLKDKFLEYSNKVLIEKNYS